jgi:type VI secretion system secreted protein VgrG
MFTGKTKVKDYNDRTPEVKVLGAGESADGSGMHHYFAPHVPDPDGANRIAKVRAQMMACGKERVDGEGICRAFRAGYRFEVDAEGPFGGKYMLTRVEHHGDQREGFESDAAVIIYTNRFACIDAGVQFRPNLSSPKPKINGVLTAKVDGPQGTYAFLDEEGRYHAKLPFDLGPEADGGASLPIRLSQPYGGPDYGMHFPIHNGNDMVLSFIDGDVDRPIALGTTPNPSNGSPVTSRNKTESVIKTASGHILRMDDDQGKTIVDLTTSGKHLLAMDDDAGSKSVKIKTSGGHLLTLDDTGKNVTILSTGGHTIKIDDGGKSITIETKGGHSMVMDDPGKTITLKDGQGVNTVTLDGGGKALTLTSTGDIKISADKNIIMTAKESITIDATKELSAHADGAVSITADKTMVQEAKKDYTLKAKKIGITSETDFIVAAKKADFKLDNDFKVAAGKVNIKADGDVILKGSKVAQN